MHRRTFMATLIASLLAAPGNVGAQATKVHRVGFLSNGSHTTVSPQEEALRRSLRELGWNEGQNIAFEDRWAEGNPDRLPKLIAELAAAKVGVIVLSGSQALRAAKSVTTIPIVFVLLTDPSASGLVASLGHPGGNMTGVASEYEALITKQLQLLKEALPGLSAVGFLRRAGESAAVLISAETAARSLRLASRRLDVAGPDEFEGAFKALSRERHVAMLVLPSPYLSAHRAELIELAARYRLPACYEFRAYVAEGGLMSYGPNINAMFARAATYVDRILRGSKPGDLPIEQPSKFELVINLKTARTLAVAVPQALLARADEVIE